MISVWWLIPAVIIGLIFGIFIISLVAANNSEREDK